MVPEPGLDLHEWETRWQEFQELAEESPSEALPEIVRLVEQMLVERNYDLENPVVMAGEDPDIVKRRSTTGPRRSARRSWSSRSSVTGSRATRHGISSLSCPPS